MDVNQKGNMTELQVMLAAMEKGYIPFEDAQFGEYAKRHGEFDAFELGFEKVNTVYSIDF
jgi:hypothetical protein